MEPVPENRKPLIMGPVPSDTLLINPQRDTYSIAYSTLVNI